MINYFDIIINLHGKDTTFTNCYQIILGTEGDLSLCYFNNGAAAVDKFLKGSFNIISIFIQDKSNGDL